MTEDLRPLNPDEVAYHANNFIADEPEEDFQEELVVDQTVQKPTTKLFQIFSDRLSN